MYTNGLKDRYGSPLLSLNDGDDRYIVKGEIEYSNKRIEQKLNAQDKIIEHHTNKINDLYDKSHHTNVQLSEHVQDDVIHFSSEEKDSFNDLFIRLDGIKGYTHETIPYNETTSDNGGEAFRIAASRLPIGKEIDEIVVPTRNTNSNGYYLALYIIASSEPVTSNNKTFVTISDNPASWTTDGEAVWTFESKPVVPEGYDLEIHIGTSQSDFTATGTTYRANGNNELKCRYKENATGEGAGQGACRYQTVWYSNRAIRVFFKKNDIQGHIGDNTHLTSEEKTEVQNLVNGVYLTGDDLDNKLGYVYNVVPNPTDYHNVNAINAVSATIPHNVVFDEIRIPAYNTSTDSYYLAIWSVLNGTKTYLGHSDEAIRWKTDTDAVWTFRNNPFSIPDGANLEMFLAASLNDIQSNTTNVPSEHILCMYKGGNGSVRWQSGWVHGRETQVIFRKAGHIADETHLTDRQISAIQGVIDGDYVTSEQINASFVTKTELDNYVSKSELGDITIFATKEEVEELKNQEFYDVWTNLKNNDAGDWESVNSFQLDKVDFIEGRIDKIEIPYKRAVGTQARRAGYLCVQFFNSSNVEISKHYSLNKERQHETENNDKVVRKLKFNFITINIPEDYAYVRFAIVDVIGETPNVNSGTQFRVMPIKRNNKTNWNTNTNTKANNDNNKPWCCAVSVYTINYAKRTGITVRRYDWTPDFSNPITVSLTANLNSFYIAPTNGWIVSKSTQTTSGASKLYLENAVIAESSTTAQADLQIMVRQGQLLRSDVAYSLTFYPCKSEQQDYRIVNTHTIYDIWKGAVVYDEFGQATVQDLYIPDARNWRSEVGSSILSQVYKVENEEAVDVDGNLLFNIQHNYIENGYDLFRQSNITQFNGVLPVLKIGEQMFGYSKLTSWSVALPMLVTADNMFNGCSSMTSFNARIDKVTSAWYMFNGCSSLTDVTLPNGLSALTDGTAMFKGCSLSYASLNNILNALPTRNGNVIEITIADSVKDDMVNAGSWEGVSIPAYNSGNYYEFTHNGWNVRLTSRTGFTLIEEVVEPDDVINEKDLSEANGNLNATSSWNTQYGRNSGIIKVINGVAYN